MHERTRGPVLIVDQDSACVGFVRTLLESAGFSTLTAATGEEALRIARAENPPLALLEIELPGLDGYQVCRALRDELGLRMAIAFLSGTRTGPIDVSSGLLMGADDYFIKPFEPSELVARVGALLRRAENGDVLVPSSRNLTSREIEVLELLTEGLDQTDIAQKLCISPRTVGTHFEHILGKLGVHSRAQAVAAAYRERLIRSI